MPGRELGRLNKTSSSPDKSRRLRWRIRGRVIQLQLLEVDSCVIVDPNGTFGERNCFSALSAWHGASSAWDLTWLPLTPPLSPPPSFCSPPFFPSERSTVGLHRKFPARRCPLLPPPSGRLHAPILPQSLVVILYIWSGLLFFFPGHYHSENGHVSPLGFIQSSCNISSHNPETPQ